MYADDTVIYFSHKDIEVIEKNKIFPRGLYVSFSKGSHDVIIVKQGETVFCDIFRLNIAILHIIRHRLSGIGFILSVKQSGFYQEIVRAFDALHGGPGQSAPPPLRRSWW
jgi:hypothetical protein